MSNDLSRARNLSPEEKRALLESLLRKEPTGSRVAPLSFAQQRLWFLEEVEDLGTAYHMPLRLRLAGPLDAAALRRALDRIVARHEVLRTTFGQVDGKPVQRIAAARADGFGLIEHDLRGAADPRAALDAFVAREAEARFDLAAGPLIRGALVRVADDEHVLLITMHHIVSDGWSLGVFGKELAALYDAFARGEPDPLPALPTQYADYAAWQRRWVAGELLERQAGYWERTLAGAPELLELPTDHPRPRKQDFAGDSVRLELDAELTTALKALSRRHGTTLFMTLLAGWAAVLGRLAGQADVVVGTPTAGRERREIEELIGFFVHTLALRVDLTGAPTVAELLRRVRARALEAQQHQDIPFEQVVERVRPARSLAYTPIFQVLFAWQEGLGDGIGLPGLRTESVAAPGHDAAKFDLRLGMWEEDGGIAGALSYATALFDRATVLRQVEYLRRALREMAADDGVRVDRLALLPADERARVVDTWNRTEADYPRGACLHEIFESQVARTPGATAVVSARERLTYGELNAEANRLAHHLRALDVGPGVRVGVCVERSPAMVTALLAVLKSGGAFVPLDPAYPRERLAYMLADSAPAVVLAQAAVRDRIGSTEVPVLELDAPAPAWADASVENPARGALTPDHPAYLTFTSGSTGQPRGVPALHHKVLNLVHWYGREFGIGERDAMLLVMSFSFDATYRNLFAPLFAGAQLHLAGETFDPAGIVERIAAVGITLMSLTPSAFQAVAEADRGGALAGVRAVLLVGEPVQPRVLLRVPEPRPEFVNLYGPTECSGAVAYHRLSPDLETYLRRPVPVGRPVANARIYVLDAAGSPVPVGAAGELYVGGTPVGPGYRNRPGQTAERFVPDPFGGEPGARLYRTGDRGRWRADGTVEFLGRVDFQVKVRGYRIEPGEIEVRLREHPSVREAVVMARDDGRGETRLVAYVVAPDADADAEALRAHLAARLPEYMVPAAYVRLGALPLTPSRKVDRKALPAPDGDAFAARGYEAPLGPAEEAVAAIWAELLGAERVGRHDDFFALGGHSLLAVRVVSRVRQALGVEASAGDLFERPVLADFARGLKGAAPAEGDAIVPVDRDGRVPLSFAQQRLWFLEQLGGMGAAYHIPMRMRLRGTLDRGALVRALDRIVARHEALRTTFPVVDGEPVQRIAPVEESAFRLVEHDLNGSADAEDAEDALRGVMRGEAGAPFDLEHGPLVRGRLVRMAPDDHVLLLTMHHIVSDGWSMGVFARELGALYAAFVRGGADPLPPLPVQYADYAAWHRRWVDGPVLEAQAEYWTQTLAGAPELLELPADRPRPARQDFAGAWLDVELDAELAASLRTLSQRHGTTLFMTLLAGWATVLGRLSGQDDVVVGTPSANRGRAEVEELIGFFVNTLPVRVDLSGEPRVAELLERVKARALDAQRNQDIPFEQVVERVQPARSLSHSPLFQVMFAWQNAPGGGVELPGLTIGGAGVSNAETAKFDLSLTLWERDGRIEGGMTYATALFERATAERFVVYLRRVLQAMAADEHARVHRLPLLPDAERRQVVEEWNRTAEYSAERCIHALFEAQAERAPGATAAVFQDRSLTYAELNARANRLAHHLIARGVGPDVPVAICVERSLEMVIAILAVLKAGGGYVPLDPGYPEDRLRFTLSDARPALLLTQAALRGRFADLDLPVLALDAGAPSWAALPETNPERADVAPHHLAYVIYTSGSTGQPKGVMVEHRNVARLFGATDAWFGFGADDVWTLFHSFAFDFSVWEIWGALLHGGRLVVVPFEVSRSPEDFYALLCREGVTVLNQTPSAFRPLIAAQQAAGGEHALRCVVFGGEALELAALRPWFARNDDRRTRLVNMYGITETTVHVTYRPVFAADAERAGPSPIGVRIPDLKTFVLDAHGQPVPVGVAGELYVGGAGVARGYLNRPELTAERFVRDPFSADPRARLYRTGDLGRWLADGTLEYLGRNDQQVKVRGFRIEPGEIRARLLEHAGVREAVVLAREGAGESLQLVAWYVADAPLEGAELRAHLSARLPEYMVPAAFVHLQALPLTPNGKVDARALPAPEGDAFASRGYEAPVGETEQALAEIWSELLGVERVGRWDHFFELGGHSLLIVKLLERMRRRGLHAEVGTLFTTPVLAELAEAVRGETLEVAVPANLIPAGCQAITPEMLPLVDLSQADIDRIVAGVEGGAGNVQDIYPLAPLQEGILFHYLLKQDRDPYLLPSLYTFERRELLEAYLGALQAVIDRHDILRTAVMWEGLPEPVQVVWRTARLQLEEVELDPAEGDATTALWARFDPRQTRMDVRRAPLVRARFAHDAAEGRWLLLQQDHHLVADGTTRGVLQAEIQAHLLGRQAELPAPLPFRNYVAQARLGASQAEHEAFFRDLLGDVREPTAPFGLLDVWSDGTESEVSFLTVDPALEARLRARARALGVSAASVCHVAWGQVLARVTGRDDVVFGTVLFGRMQGGEGADRVMGLFVNTLPVRVRVGGEGAEASVRAMHRQLAQLLRHEHASLGLAQRSSGVEAPAPLFTSFLNYRHKNVTAQTRSSDEQKALDGMRWLRTEDRSNYPVGVSVNDWETELFMSAQAPGSVGAARVCALMHRALEALVDALEAAPGRAVGTLDVLPQAERRLVVEEWNRTEAGYPRDACVHELFEAQVERTPGAAAVVFGERTLGYAELNARANRLAHHLRALGVGPDVRVAICVERGPEMVVAVLAVLKAGGAYVPLDPAYPAERLRYMLVDSAPGVVLTQSSLAAGGAGLFDGLGVPVLALDAPAWGDAPETNPARGALRPEHLAYVIYTSGSTGTPKGVGVAHRNVCALVAAQDRVLGVDADSRVLQFASFSFDACVFEMVMALSRGASLHVPAGVELLAGDALERAVARGRITHVVLPPAVLPTLSPAADFSSVRTMVLAGEAVPASAVERWAGQTRVLNAYGPTEAAVWATFHACRADEPGNPPIGLPIPNARVYLLDAAGRPVPVGVAGELYIGGAGVARGYLGRPALTAERFVPDGFGGEPGARLYRTGDLGRRRVDGSIDFLGRNDFQVKIRGFRIELGEIEGRLREHSAVREAVVLARDEGSGDQRLVAYWVGDEAEAEALRAHLGERLPEYMVPAAYVRLDAFPLTPSGKLDRRALPSPEGDAFAAGEYEAPRGETEQALAEIWSEVLGAERVGRRDDFFDLGGHSLLVVLVISRIRQVLDLEVEPGTVFAHPVLKDLAEVLAGAARAELPPIEPVDRGERLPLSFAQQRLWFLEQMGDLGGAYHAWRRLRLHGALDRDALVRALDRLVARHEALRTTFASTNGEPEQRIAPETTRFALAEHDLTGRAGALEWVARMTGEESAAPFELEQGPLIRGRLIRLAEDDHVLLVTMHHIVSDGWSMGVLVDELSRLYGAFRAGRPDPLAPLPIQYADYAAWQRRWVKDEVLEAQAGYWTRALDGAPALLELPTDHPRPQRQDHAGARLWLELDETLTAGLRALGRRSGTTLFMTVLAGWATVLSRLSGQGEVVIGTPTANRARPEVERLIGFFVNTLALRIDLSDRPTVTEVLGRVKARSLEAQQNQDIPFEQVVERVQPARSLAHTPLFQVFFSWQDAPGGGRLQLPGLEMGSVPGAERTTATFDLSLTLGEWDGRIEGSLEYATSLYDRVTVERYAGYLHRVLEQMAADGARTVDRLELVPDAERRMVVEEWNRAPADLPGDACVHQLFQAQVERAPGAVAVEFEGGALTYAELDSRANRLAHHLRGMRVGRDVPVGVCVEPGPEMLAAVLGVLKAGGGYVPLDPSYPGDRLAWMLADSGARLLVTHSTLLDSLPLHGVDTVALDRDAEAIAGYPPTAPATDDSDPSSLAYVIYTSGSTGRPKGVRVEHGALVATLSAAREAFGFGADDAAPAMASFAFDIWLFEALLPLLAGGAVRPFTRAQVLEVPRLVEELAGCTVLHAVPALMRRIVEEVRAAPGGVLPALRRAFVGGDAVAPDLLEEMREAFPAAAIHVLYGPTEATIICAAHRLGREPASRQMVGRPLGNATLYVVDAGGAPVPLGVPGELCLGGRSVARDYLGRPELTAERFVPDPFAADPGARLYRTGDRVRWLPTGELEFLGRTDRQVKVRGFRIEPAEIEARLREHPGVRDAVVDVREDVPGDRRLVAYLVPADAEVERGAAPGELAAEVRGHLLEHLPGYMVPAAYVELHALPLTPNGKVDRRALPAPAGEGYGATAYEAPSGPVEEALAEIWSEVLGVERVGRWDDFFALGGHSLLAVQVVSRVRRALGAEAALGDLFARPVLADFARTVDEAARAELPPIERADRGGRLPLSFAQQRLWFVEQLDHLGSTYHISRRLRLRGELDRAALLRALDRLVARHEALRTTFPVADGEPEQRIAAESIGFHLVEHDVSGEGDEAFEAVLAEEAAEPFDLARGPLIRGRLVRLGADDHVLLLTIHHIVSDGWSMGVLVGELGRLYGAFRAGRPDPLPALPVQYADYAVWQRRWVQDQAMEAQAAYWARTLAGAPELLELPADHPRPQRQDHAGASLRVELGAELTAGLKALGRRHGTTLFMTLLAGWATVLSRLSGQDEVVVGTPTANRGRPEIEGLIGFFVNTLALRVDLAGAPSVAELLAQVKARALEAQQNQDIPFEQVVELVQPARSMAHSPLFQVMLAWQNAPGSDLQLPGLELGQLPGEERTTAKFDISLALWESGGRIVGGVTYATSLFERATVERYLGYLRRVLARMVADDAQAVDRLELLPDAERRRVVEEWNRTDAPYPARLCLHELFEAQVARTPDAVAVVFGDDALTYDALNRRANRLAHRLRALGVGPDTRVAICVERGPEMVVGVLGALKAGGAYVPLDPAYPAERLRDMLRDSAPGVVLTQASVAAAEWGLFEGLNVEVLLLDLPRWHDEPDTDPERGSLTPEHLAYVIYTSGSTGRAKGVMVPHRAVVNRLQWGREAWGRRTDEVVFQGTSLSFDVSLWELFRPLTAGARVVLARLRREEDSRHLPTPLIRHGVTRAHFVPSLLQHFLEMEGVEGCTALEQIVCAGEPLPAALLGRVGELLPGARVHNLYGPSEAASSVAFIGCGPPEGVHVPIGRPTANARVYILDRVGQPVPAGVAGELHVGGVGLARGYLDRPRLTADRFVPDPFGGRPGARLYRTGDLGRWRPGGIIEFLGRNDFQVKIRGFRIELGEIEARLREHPAVTDAVVTAREDAAGDPRLVAYWTGDEAQVQALRAHLGERLPEYMVPAAYVRLEALPLTPNGKLDRKALPAPEGDAYARRGYEVPVGATEAALAEIWSELLGVAQVGRWDNFFELGGHSLLIVKLIERMRRRDLHVDIGTLFSKPTLAELAEAVSGERVQVMVVPPNLIPHPVEDDPEQAEPEDAEVYL